MKSEILSLRSELTSGQNLDTNSQWLSRRLAESGVAVGWHTTIADDLDANIDAVRIAAGRAGLVLLTGGLGPTQDGLTRHAPARGAGGGGAGPRPPPERDRAARTRAPPPQPHHAGAEPRPGDAAGRGRGAAQRM